MLVVDRSECLDGMRQGVDAAVGCDLGRTRQSQQRVNEGDTRTQSLAEDAEFHLLNRVCQDG